MFLIRDFLELIFQLILLSYEYQVKKNPCLSAINVRIKLYLYHQAEDQSLLSYFREFKAQAEVVKIIDGSIRIRRDGGLYELDEDLFVEMTGNKFAQDDEIEYWNNDYVLSVLVIQNACNKRYLGLKQDLQNQYNKGIDQYPMTMNRAFKMLEHYMPPRIPKANIKIFKKVNLLKNQTLSQK